jgi:hypothetical protein
MRGSRRSCASAFCSACFVLVAGCGRAYGESGAPDAGKVASSLAPQDAGSNRASGGSTISGSAPANGCAAAPATYDASKPISVRSIGHTSYVLKIRFDDGRVAAFKPRSTRPLGESRYRAEIAAYRLACALDLANVPPAIPEAFVAAALEAAANAEDRAAFERSIRVDGDGRVRGALIPWIDDYEVLPLEDPAWRVKWSAWLSGAAAIAEPDRRLAGAISTMLAFDYLTANWDRWSGANVARHAQTGELLFVDNDGAFYEHPSQTNLSQQLERLRGVAHYSRSFVRALRALTPQGLQAAFGDESLGRPLLPEAVIAAVDARRAALLQVIDSRIERSGESDTLSFE